MVSLHAVLLRDDTVPLCLISFLGNACFHVLDVLGSCFLFTCFSVSLGTLFLCVFLSLLQSLPSEKSYSQAQGFHI